MPVFLFRVRNKRGTPSKKKMRLGLVTGRTAKAAEQSVAEDFVSANEKLELLGEFKRRHDAGFFEFSL
jgi:hypothetical protein